MVMLLLRLHSLFETLSAGGKLELKPGTQESQGRVRAIYRLLLFVWLTVCLL